jgi:hypothetical protein
LTECRDFPQPQDYYVTVTHAKTKPLIYCWEIRRKKLDMGVKLKECGFQTYKDAADAGKFALREFLERLAREQS